MTVYIKLLHGRDDPNQQMEDWGFNGPVLGPFEAVHVTYRDHIRCIRNSSTENEIELGFTDDMLTYEGKYYGDFEIAAEFGSDTPLSPFAALMRACRLLADAYARGAESEHVDWSDIDIAHDAARVALSMVD